MSGQTTENPLDNLLSNIRSELKNADMLGSYAEHVYFESNSFRIDQNKKSAIEAKDKEFQKATGREKEQVEIARAMYSSF
ncbi:hypothetical protein INT46_001939 [Mucor plumbeus]|uniref:Uncharacterized protein n=1 Tax=Mucor plumbeus TaxID=97098 RepID=A0A8H7UT57_9FUNG|nr:hypothetical protein INT46_001939 [Mucor plumbeus]